jgi:hypothetical protein
VKNEEIPCLPARQAAFAEIGMRYRVIGHGDSIISFRFQLDDYYFGRVLAIYL